MTKATTPQSSTDSLCEIKCENRLKELRLRITELEDYSAEPLDWVHHLDTIRKQLMLGLLDEQDEREKDQARCAELESALQGAFTHIEWYREKYPEAEADAGKRFIH